MRWTIFSAIIMVVVGVLCAGIVVGALPLPVQLPPVFNQQTSPAPTICTGPYCPVNYSMPVIKVDNNNNTTTTQIVKNVTHNTTKNVTKTSTALAKR